MLGRAPLLLLVLTVGLATNVRSNPAEPPILEAGDTWIYQIVDIPWNKVSEETRVVESTDQVNGQKTYVVSVSIVTKHWIMNSSISFRQWITPDWTLLEERLTWSDGADEVRHYEPGLRLYAFPLELDKEWKTPLNMSGQISHGNGSVEIFWRGQYSLKVVGHETILVPAGAFDAYVVQRISKTGYERILYYFSPEVKNTVKEEFQKMGGGKWNTWWKSELINYSVREDAYKFTVGWGPFLVSPAINLQPSRPR